MREQAYQSKLIKEYEREGYYVINLIQTNKSGIPDLLCLKPDHILFVEVKTSIGRPSKLQEYRIRELKKFGFDAIIKKYKK
tara:strand:+ start:780 stop:1022 length:243 start_codon:yes stop_codon:yes gene_type:complete